MKFLSLVLKSARRSKRRTALTVLSVAIAVFLFASLRAVLDGFNAGAEASSSTRIVTQRSTSLFFAMPISHGEAIKGTAGVQDVTWANWFGGVYKDPQNFFAQYAIEPESYLRMYPEILLDARGEARVPRRPHRLHRRGRAGPELRVQDRRQDHAAGRHPDVWDAGTSTSPSAASTSRAARRSTTSRCSFIGSTPTSGPSRRGLPGGISRRFPTRIRRRRCPVPSTRSSRTRPFETKTDTEKAFQATFVSMFGNINLLLGSVALAVVITTLFVAGNTMAMSVRERTMEIAVMRTLGFQSATIFLLVAGEGLLMALGGGVFGALLARLLVNPSFFPSGGFIPEITVNNTNVAIGVGLSAVIGIVAGVIPATMASRLKIVDALRRVA